MIVRLATRASALALWQAGRVAEIIGQRCPGVRVELVRVSTVADRHAQRPIREFGDKGVFVKEIEEAILCGNADAGVHSLKDVPGELPEGLDIVAVPERSDPRDVLVTRTGGGLDSLQPGAEMATSSLRRRGQLLRMRPDLVTVEVRGNVETRLQKLRDGRFDALVMAAAGLRRLGRAGEIAEHFATDRMVPAAGQGAIAVEAPAASEFADIWQRIDNPDLAACVCAERDFVAALGGDCHTPVGCHCRIEQGTLSLAAMVCSADGREYLEWTGACGVAEAPGLARTAAQETLDRGGAAIVAAARSGSDGHGR